MAFLHAVSTNNYGPAKLIVATSAANGTHVTLASAMADAVSGDTIFLRDSVTENVSLTAGVNIAAWTGGSLNTPSITGTLTMTAAGTCNISGICLVTNSSFFLTVSGSAASIVNLENCYLNCSNNTGISFTTSSSSAQININKCKGDIGTTGISLFASTSAGSIGGVFTSIGNSGSSVTASTISAGNVNFINWNMNFPITTSSTAGILLNYCIITAIGNTTALTVGGSGTSSISLCQFVSGSASAVSVGASGVLTLDACKISSSNANGVTGVGSVTYTDLVFDTTTSTVNTTTQASHATRNGIIRSTLQPLFIAYQGADQTNATGDGTVYTLGTTTDLTELVDQGVNFAPTTGTFTAPVAGMYLFTGSIRLGAIGAAHTFTQLTVVTTSRTFFFGNQNPAVTKTIAIVADLVGIPFTCVANMAANDTCTFAVNVSGSTKTVTVKGTASPNLDTFVMGYLIC